MTRKKHLRHITAAILTLSLMLIAIALSGCAKRQPLPADWPLKVNIIPRDAEIKTSTSSKSHDTLEELKEANPAKAELVAGRMKDVSIWTVNFTAEMSWIGYLQLLDSNLRKEGYRYTIPDLSGYEHLETGMIRDYYSPDGTISITAFYMPISGFTLTVTQYAEPNMYCFDSASPIE